MKKTVKKMCDWNCTWKQIVKKIVTCVSRENAREVELHQQREERVLLEFCWPLHGNTHQVAFQLPRT